MTAGTQRAALAVLALLAASLVIWLSMPVGVGILILTWRAGTRISPHDRAAGGARGDRTEPSGVHVGVRRFLGRLS